MLALAAVEQALDQVGIGYEVAWSPVFRPGALRLEDAAPDRYTHLVFVCGPVHGAPVADLHTRFATLRRIAVGVSVIDRTDPACRGFDLVLARDGDQGPPRYDLSAAVPPHPPPRTTASTPAPPVPVTGVVLASGQGEYGLRRRHEQVTGNLTGWLGGKTCAPVPLETRLDSRDWRLCSSANAFETLLSRMDVVVTTRLHGLALALRAGLPALAVDPVEGGGKVTAQASAWQWPAILSAVQAGDPGRLDELWAWCLSPDARQAATTAARTAPADAEALLAALVTDLRSDLLVHGVQDLAQDAVAIRYRTCGAAHVVDLGLQALGLGLQGQHPADARQVETVPGQQADLLQPGHVVAAVAAGPARGPARADQAFALVDPERLRVQSGLLRGRRDAEQPLVQVVPVRAGTRHMPECGPPENLSRRLAVTRSGVISVLAACSGGVTGPRDGIGSGGVTRPRAGHGAVTVRRKV